MKKNLLTYKDYIITGSLVSATLLLLMRYTILSSSLKWGTWSYGENLISYPGKFIRRGLLGEIVLFLSGDNPAFKTLNLIVFLNCILLLFLIYILFKKFNLEIKQFNILMISSFGLLYLVYHGFSYNRKEIFAINFFLIFIYLLKKNNNKLNTGIRLYLISSLLLLALMHEGTLFITIPFYYLILKNIDLKFSYIYSVSGILLILFLITQQGNSQDVLRIWNELSTFDRELIGSDLESSAIYALNYSVERQLIIQSGLSVLNNGTINHWLHFLFYFGIYFFLNHLGCKLDNLSKLANSINLFPIELIFCIPLFLFGGADWGRYLVFFIYMYYFYILYIADIKKINLLSIGNTKFISIFAVYSFFTVMPQASFQDIDLLNKLINSFQQIFQLIS